MSCPLLRVLILPSFFLGMIGLTACAKRESPVEAGLRTQTLHIGNAFEPRDLDPHIVTSYADVKIINALMEGLMSSDPMDGQAIPGVAETWESSRDGHTWTFHLRESARWSNGDRVVAADFVYGIRRVLSKALGAEYATFLFCLDNDEAFNAGRLTDFNAVGVHASDQRTLVLRLNSPVPYLPNLLSQCAWYPVHQATIEKHGSLDARGTNWTRPGNYVGNGPFVLTHWTPNQSIRVTRSKTYWDRDRVRLNEAVFYPMETLAEEASFRAGQLHVTSFYIPASKAALYRASAEGKALLHESPMLSTTYLEVNCTRPPLNDARVRRALSLAIDRVQLATKILQADLAAGSFVPPGCGEYRPPQSLAFDLETAVRLMVEAGYTGGRGLRPLEVGFSVTSAVEQTVLEAIQQMWRKHLGVEVTLMRGEEKVLQDALHHQQFDLMMGGWIGDYLDPTTFLDLLQSANGNNHGKWANTTYDGLLEQATRTMEVKLRYDLLRRAEELMLVEAPMIPLYYFPQRELRQPMLKGWHNNVLGRHPLNFVYLER